MCSAVGIELANFKPYSKRKCSMPYSTLVTFERRKMLPETAEKRRWYFVYANKLTCVFGIFDNGKIRDISAKVERENDGKWRWTIIKTNRHGLEPDRISAMQIVMDILDLSQEEREKFLRMDVGKYYQKNSNKGK